MRRFVSPLMLAMLSTLSLQAQAPCRDTETIQACQQRFANDILQAETTEKKVAANAVNQETRQKLTSPDTSGNVSTSSVKDFLPPLAIVVQSVNLDQKNQQVVIDFNLPDRITPKSTAIQLQSIIHQPQIFASVQSQLNATQTQGLTNELGDLDDVSGILTIGIHNRYWGRRLADNNDVFVRLFNAIVPPKTPPAARTDCTTLSQRLPHKHGPDPTFGDYDRSGREELRKICTQDAIAAAEDHGKRARILKESSITHLVNLLNNQPQALFTTSYRAKKDLVGPDEASLQISGEWSPRSINGFRGEIEDIDKKNLPPDKTDEAILSAFERFAHNADTVGRYKFTVQYERVNKYTLAIPADSLDVKVPEATRWTGSLTYGKSLLFGSDGKETGRIDAALQYDNFSDDPKHRDRGIASLTYTQKLNKDFSFPIGLIYANHERFLGEVQKRFSAHFGLKAKLPFS